MNEKPQNQNLTPEQTSEKTVPDSVFAVKVTHVTHFTDRLFMFRVERPSGFRFRSGEFAMITLPTLPKPIYRAYSIASPAWDETIEFYSIKVEDGPLTQHLQHVAIGDTIWMKKKTTGTLVLDALLPGKRLWMISTGTGFAPFASLIREPESYERFEQVYVTHTCRTRPELTYSGTSIAAAKTDPLVGELAENKLHLFQSLTQDSFEVEGRITTLLNDSTLFNRLNIPPMNKADDRVMICGSVNMLDDVKQYCLGLGMTEGSNARPAEFVIERAFVG